LGLWDANTGEKLNDYFIGMTSPLFVDWHPSEAKVAFTTLDEVVVWDIEHWQELYRLPADEVDAISVAWSPVGDRLASVGEEGIVRVWDGDTGDLLREIKMRAFERGLPRVFWSGDGNLVGAIVGNRIEAWNAQSGRRAFSEEVAQPVVGLIWKPDGRIIAASQDDNNAAEMPLLQTLRE
jgi:WD40 repeat protein